MRRLLAPLTVMLALALAGPAPAASTRDAARVPAGTYVLDKRHAAVTAKVRHMGLSRYVMRFNVVDARFDYDPADPLAAKVTASVDVTSLDVGGDGDIARQFVRQFLDGDDHPTATFVSTKLEQTGEGQGRMTGDLTFRGVTLPVTFDVVFDGYDATLVGGRRAGFSATGRIDRTAFGSTFLSPGIVADDVDIEIEAEFVKE